MIHKISRDLLQDSTHNKNNNNDSVRVICGMNDVCLNLKAEPLCFSPAGLRSELSAELKSSEQQNSVCDSVLYKLSWLSQS